MIYKLKSPKHLIAGKDYTGLFITFEGPEGSGKSTQSEIIHNHLSKYYNVSPWTKEPGAPQSQLQTDMRKLYFFSKEKRSDLADLFFMLCDRNLHQEYLLNELNSGNLVICDRYADSTRAYQGNGGGIDINLIDAFNAYATNGLEPDITFLVDVSYETGLLRKKGDIADHFESKKKDFHQRVRQGYLNLSKSNPDRFILIDGEPSLEEVTRNILFKLQKHSAFKEYIKRTI